MLTGQVDLSNSILARARHTPGLHHSFRGNLCHAWCVWDQRVATPRPAHRCRLARAFAAAACRCNVNKWCLTVMVYIRNGTFVHGPTDAQNQRNPPAACAHGVPLPDLHELNSQVLWLKSSLHGRWRPSPASSGASLPSSPSCKLRHAAGASMARTSIMQHVQLFWGMYLGWPVSLCQ